MGLLGRSASDEQLSEQVAMLSRQVQRLQELVERLAAQQGVAPPPPLVPTSAPPAPPSAGDAGVDAEVMMLVQQGQKIHAIKLVRERTGLGLKEAKDIVDRL